ncbi:MAG: hypothetical protein HZA83_00310 [Thaumarchaeota archaeon]|nr:hypothetical protein [Nitrososphaerota archaeon]
MGITEYDLRQLLYFHYNDLQAFTVDDVLRKAKMSLNRNTTKEEVEKLLNILEVNNAVSRSNNNSDEMHLSKKLIRNKCTNCTFVFYVGDSIRCPNCGGTLQPLE